MIHLLPRSWTARCSAGARCDMKYMVAMELETMLLLKRSGLPLKRDVIFMAAADEEAGGHQGAGWLAEHHPDLIDAEYALNEGGGTGMALNDVVYYTVQTGEKGTARFRLRTRGTPGHGSQPHDDNAIDQAGADAFSAHCRRSVCRSTSPKRYAPTSKASPRPSRPRLAHSSAPSSPRPIPMH